MSKTKTKFYLKITLNKYSQRKAKELLDEVIFWSTDSIKNLEQQLNQINKCKPDDLIWLRSKNNSNQLFLKKNIYKIETWESKK